MRALVQRVSRASVTVADERVAAIGPGLPCCSEWRTTTTPRAPSVRGEGQGTAIFADADGRMNEPLGEREVLCVSQFTLYGETQRGTRPSFAQAAAPDHARELYELFCDALGAARGRFGAMMAVELVNDGPVTLMLEMTTRHAQ